MTLISTTVSAKPNVGEQGALSLIAPFTNSFSHDIQSEKRIQHFGDLPDTLVKRLQGTRSESTLPGSNPLIPSILADEAIDKKLFMAGSSSIFIGITLDKLFLISAGPPAFQASVIITLQALALMAGSPISKAGIQSCDQLSSPVCIPFFSSFNPEEIAELTALETSLAPFIASSIFPL